MQIRKTTHSAVSLLTLALLLAASSQSLEAQLVVSETGTSSLNLDGQAWANNELKLWVTVSEAGYSSLKLDGVAKVGKHVENDFHRNSFWVDLVLVNATKTDLKGIKLSLTTSNGTQDPLDGLSFGALSVAKQKAVLEKRKDKGSHADNLWGFTGDVGGKPLDEGQIEFPIKATKGDTKRFHKFSASGTSIEVGQTLMLRFMVTQNGPANQAHLGFELIPEPGPTAIVFAGMALGAAFVHQKRRRKQCPSTDL